MKYLNDALAVFGALAMCVIFAGCSRTDSQSTSIAPAAVPTTAGHGHDHDHGGHGAGPHDGTLADWGGGKFHVEFTVDHDKQEATVYILGDDEKTPVAIPATEIQLGTTEPAMQVALKAAPQDTDPEGSASRFVGTHESLGLVREFAGTITGVVDGTPYSGDFREEPHGH